MNKGRQRTHLLPQHSVSSTPPPGPFFSARFLNPQSHTRPPLPCHVCLPFVFSRTHVPFSLCFYVHGPSASYLVFGSLSPLSNISLLACRIILTAHARMTYIHNYNNNGGRVRCGGFSRVGCGGGRPLPLLR